MTIDLIMAGDKAYISIHIPRVGDDRRLWTLISAASPFQSTSPVWGMTLPVVSRGGSLAISIHIPRVGDDDTYETKTARFI